VYSDCAYSWWQVHLVQVTFDPDLQGPSKVQLIGCKYEYMSIYYLKIKYCSLTTAYVAVDCMTLDCIGAELFSKTCRRFYPGTVCASGSSSCCLKSLAANLPWPEMDLMIGAALDTLQAEDPRSQASALEAASAAAAAATAASGSSGGHAGGWADASEAAAELS